MVIVWVVRINLKVILIEYDLMILVVIGNVKKKPCANSPIFVGGGTGLTAESVLRAGSFVVGLSDR